MARTDAVRNGSMSTVDRLLSLFTAYRERNEYCFYFAAEAIIADELAANHHAQARDLQRALAANGRGKSVPCAANGYVGPAEKERRHGEPLVAMIEPRAGCQPSSFDSRSQKTGRSHYSGAQPPAKPRHLRLRSEDQTPVLGTAGLRQDANRPFNRQ